MSRKAADLSGEKLTFGQKCSKFWSTDLPRWFYNKDDGSFLGERRPIEWGKLLLYYLCFWSGLTVFFTACFLIMLASAPQLPDDLYYCVEDGTLGQSFCHFGPRFKVLPLGSLSDKTDTVGTMDYVLAEPTLTVSPAELIIGASDIDVVEFKEVSSQTVYNGSAHREWGFAYLLKEILRASCDSAPAGLCQPYSDKVVPSIPKFEAGSFTGYTTLAESQAFFDNQDNFYGPKQEDLGDEFYAAKPYQENLDLGVTGGAFNVYLSFFRLNKLWGYVPYSEAIEVQNAIVVDCNFSTQSVCKAGDTGRDFEGNVINCCDGDGENCTKKLSNGGALYLDMLDTSIGQNLAKGEFVNSDGYPWEGGAYRSQFGAVATTWDRSKALGTLAAKSDLDAPVVECEWGVGTATVPAVANRVKRNYPGNPDTQQEPFGKFKIAQVN